MCARPFPCYIFRGVRICSSCVSLDPSSIDRNYDLRSTHATLLGISKSVMSVYASGHSRASLIFSAPSLPFPYPSMPFHALPCSAALLPPPSFLSGAAPHQPHHGRQVRDQEDLGPRAGDDGGPGERPAGDEPPALSEGGSRRIWVGRRCREVALRRASARERKRDGHPIGR